MSAQHEIDRLARMSPETLRAALIVAEKRRVRTKRSDLKAMPEGERAFVTESEYRDAMERASAKFLIALRSRRCRSTELVGNWSHQTQRQWLGRDTGHPEDVVRLQAERESLARRVVKRDPCAHCGVRGDMHAAHGCGRYAA